MGKRLGLILVAIFLFCGIGETANNDKLWYLFDAPEKEIIEVVQNMTYVSDGQTFGIVFGDMFQKGKWSASKTDTTPAGNRQRAVTFRGYFKNTQGTMKEIEIVFILAHHKDFPSWAPWSIYHSFGNQSFQGLPDWLKYELLTEADEGD